MRRFGLYAEWGIQQIVVIDPKTRIIWSFQNGALQPTETIARRGEQTISAQKLWAEVDKRL